MKIIYLIIDYLKVRYSIREIVDIAFELCWELFNEEVEIRIELANLSSLERHIRMKDSDVVIMLSTHPNPRISLGILYPLSLCNNLKKPYLLIKIK